MANKTKRKRRKFKTEQYKGWTIRHIVPKEGDAHTTPYWQTDNGDRCNRKRASHKTRESAMLHVDGQKVETENFGKTFSIDDELRIEALNVSKELNGRARISDLLQFWKERHPTDGLEIPIEDMVTRYLATRMKDGTRPGTYREMRQKLGIFMKERGRETPISQFWQAEVEQFILTRPGGALSRRTWLKVLKVFFEYCKKQGAVKVNAAAGIELNEKIAQRGTPSFMDAQDVESVMRAVEKSEPSHAPAFAILFFAGIRPTELFGQYGLEDPRVRDAKNEAIEARKIYTAELHRLGLVRGRGGDTTHQRNLRAGLNNSIAAENLARTLKDLAKARKLAGKNIRPGLNWADINLDERFIRIRAETSKVNSARLVDISENLAAWLSKYAVVGNAPVVSNPTSFRRARDRILAELETVKWSPDVARHTFATMYFKAHQNREKLQAQMGHTGSSAVLELHYKGLATAKEAERFWSILPVDSKENDSGVAKQIIANS